MNTDTKRHIDSARQVLVVVVPNPTSQIDQIINTLVESFKKLIAIYDQKTKETIAKLWAE